MKFSRQISPADTATSLPKIERYFRNRGLALSKESDDFHAELFRWSELLTVKDPDQLSWHSLRLVREEAGIRIHFAYNWKLSALAHALLSALVFTVVARFGVPAMVTPMLVSTNAIFFAASAFFAHHYAHGMAKELAALTGHAPPAAIVAA